MIGGAGHRSLYHGRSVPAPYTVAKLQPRARAREYAQGHRFGVFVSDPSDSRARTLVGSAVTFDEACDLACELARTEDVQERAHGRQQHRRTKHTGTNGALTPPGYTVTRNRWEHPDKSVWRAFRNDVAQRDFGGKRARQEAVAWCWADYREREARKAPPPADEVDDEVEALFRQAREDAGGVQR